MTRPKTDPELSLIAAAVRALEGIEPSRRVAALDYINSRFLTPLEGMLPMIHDDDSDEDDRAPWPHELEPGGDDDRQA